jgi:UDP:flavonoid glycosyltransferase YjiC (YdhE family)
MHAIFATMGTDGDVFPHIGVGACLRSRGHRVTIAAPEPYRRLAEQREAEQQACSADDRP